MFKTSSIILLLFMVTQLPLSNGLLTRASKITVPYIGKFNLSKMAKVGESITSLVIAFAKSDYLFVAIKIVNILRDIIKFMGIEDAAQLDTYLEMLQRFLEYTYSFLGGIKESALQIRLEEKADGNDFVLDEKAGDKSLWVQGNSLITKLSNNLL